MSKTIEKPETEAVVLNRLVRRSERPQATERNRSIFVSHCMFREGMSMKDAYDAFDRANRKLWYAATA